MERLDEKSTKGYYSVSAALVESRGAGVHCNLGWIQGRTASTGFY